MKITDAKALEKALEVKKFGYNLSLIVEGIRFDCAGERGRPNGPFWMRANSQDGIDLTRFTHKIEPLSVSICEKGHNLCVFTAHMRLSSHQVEYKKHKRDFYEINFFMLNDFTWHG